MINSSLIKDTLREIRHTKSRFLSIFAIILVGVAFFAGLVASGPVMIETANHYFDQQDLADMEILSPIGFTDRDIEDIGNKDNTTMDSKSMIDVLIDNNQATRLYGLNDEDELNQYIINDGRLPEKPNEIALDDTSDMRETYAIGDSVNIVTETSEDYPDNLTEDSFEVVGFVQSPAYIERATRGNTNIGTGTIAAYGVVLDEVIDTDQNLIHLSFDEADQYDNVYSEEYESFIEGKIEEYEEAFDGRAQERQQELVDEANEELESARNDISDAREQLDQGRDELEEARNELDDAWDEIEEQQQQIDAMREMYGPSVPQVVQAQAQIDAATEELETSEQEYEEALAEFEEEETDALADISDAEAEMEEAEEDVADLEAMSVSMNFNSALDYPGLSEYGENAERIEAISTIFPVFFFALALLISLTTMSRMVDEGRTQIGTMKALGYNNFGISVKYFTYALIATVFGSIIGLIIGFWLFPSVIVDAYSAQYQLIDPQLNYYSGIIIIAMLGAILATSTATFMSLRSLLKNNAAVLLRPKAPKSEQRILLERIPWLWNKLSFTYKVSIRNLFRYKGRMIMTIIGVAGGIALMLTGFGISDSLQDVGEIQFDQLSDYNALSIIDTDADDSAIEDVESKISEMDITDDFIRVSTENMTVHAEGSSHDLSIMTPEDVNEFPNYVHLVDYDTEEILNLANDSAILTQKMSELADVSVGDTLLIEDEDGHEFEVEVGGIVEHYVNHNLYMTPDYYESIFDDTPEQDTRLIKYTEDVSEEEESEFEDELSELEANIAVVLQRDNLQAVEDSLGSLETVTVVLIVSAGILAFVVLYNLTNINVSERIKELSTIKVLGFYDKEVTRYVYRETFSLTILGILVGIVLGILLHQFILTTVELDFLMFSRYIHLSSHLYASALMIVFSVSVMILMHFKLKKVNMVEALKAND